MSIKAIIIESSPDYRALISHHLTTRWPGAKVTEFDPEASGPLPDSFSGAGNDLVILGDPLGEHSGLEWLRRFVAIKGFPPVVILGDGNERSIVRVRVFRMRH